MVDYFVGRGGQLRTKARLQKVLLGSGGAVEGFQLADGSTVTGDLYISAMPGARSLHTLCNTGMPARHMLFENPPAGSFQRRLAQGLAWCSLGISDIQICRLAQCHRSQSSLILT